RAMQALVAVSIASITLSPVLYRAGARIERRFAKGAAPAESEGRPDPSQRVIVVGYGPVGRAVTQLFAEHELEATVIELNHDTVRALLAEGKRAIYGDASQPRILEAAGVKEAGSLVFAAFGTPSDAVIRAAKELNPNLRVIA